jgi:hypothetical protein
MLFEKKDVVATARRIDGDARAGGPAPDDHEVPRIAALIQTRDHVGAAHLSVLARSSLSTD